MVERQAGDLEVRVRIPVSGSNFSLEIYEIVKKYLICINTQQVKKLTILVYCTIRMNEHRRVIEAGKGNKYWTT